MRRGMYLYPWDLEEEGPAAILPRLRDAGLDSISLAVSYHAGKFVRPHAPGKRVYFPEDGTIYFTPEAARYGRIKPLVNSRAADGYDALAVLAAAGDFAVSAWTVGLHNTPLGLAHPDVVVRNAFGDPLWNALCPAQPDVQDYIVGLCTDLAANHPLAEISIETPGWQAFRHGHHHEFELIELTPRAQILLGMCFCPACRAGASAAGVDVAALWARTRAELELFFWEGAEPATDPATDPDWRAFTAWRISIVNGLVQRIRDELPSSVGLAIVPTTQSPNDLCWIEGSDLAELATFCRLEVPAYQNGVPAIAADIAYVRASAGPDARIGYILRPTFPNLATAVDVRAAVAACVADEAQSVSFYNYGPLRLSALDWIRAAFND